MANERRTFSRIHFEAETTVQQDRTLWLVNLLDISLKGLLIDKPKDWDGDANTPFHAAIHLNDSSHITMKIQQRHETDEHIGFECLHIDIDSIAHLRRLVELNIGDLALLEREVSALIGQN